MLTSAEVEDLRKLDKESDMSTSGVRIVQEVLKQIEERKNGPRRWSDHHVWPVYSKDYVVSKQ